MSKANPTAGERMVAIETKINNIEETNKDQYKLLNKIDGKLDNVISCKADKSEVNILRSKVNKITWQVMTGLIFLLIAVTGFLIRYTLFK